MRRLRASRFLGLTMLGLFLVLVTVHDQKKPAGAPRLRQSNPCWGVNSPSKP